MYRFSILHDFCIYVVYLLCNFFGKRFLALISMGNVQNDMGNCWSTDVLNTPFPHTIISRN